MVVLGSYIEAWRNWGWVMSIAYIMEIVSQIYYAFWICECIACLLYLLVKLLKGKTDIPTFFSIQSVASIGNTLNSVHLAVEAIQKTVDEHKKTLESLQSSMVRSVNMRERQHLPAHSFLCQSHDPNELSSSYSACFKKTKTKQNAPTSNVYSLVCHLYLKPWR